MTVKAPFFFEALSHTFYSSSQRAFAIRDDDFMIEKCKKSIQTRVKHIFDTNLWTFGIVAYVKFANENNRRAFLPLNRATFIRLHFYFRIG